MKLDRMLGIVHTLANTERLTAKDLAERFEVSQRTIHRDIEAICMAGIPVVTYPGGNGGIGLAPGYKLDKKALTEPELRSILTGLQSLESIGFESESRHLRSMLAPLGSDRIVSLSPTEATYVFRELPPVVMDPDRMFHKAHMETAVLLVHPDAEFKLLDEFGPNSYEKEETGWLRFSFPYVNHEWMLAFIFSLADKARVLAPESLVRTVSERAQAMARLYDLPLESHEP